MIDRPSSRPVRTTDRGSGRTDKDRRPSALLLVFLFAVAAFAVVVGVHWGVSGFLHSRKVVVVPDLSGKTLEQALDLLTPLHLGLGKEAVQFDENSPPGAILRQSPPIGLSVREGKIVRVTLSSGGQVVFVPDLVSVSITEAQNRLRASGLTLGAVSQVYSLQNETGKVLEQNPLSGGVAPPSSMVDLKVSKGPPPAGVTLMPDFISQPTDAARAWAETQKISPEVKEEVSSIFPPGVVMRQSPALDSPVTEKTPLTFVVTPSTASTSDPDGWPVP